MFSRRALRPSALLATFLMMAGCSFLPAPGPHSWDIRSGQQDPESLPYALVRITPKVLKLLATGNPRLATTFTDRRPPKEIRFGIGDIVSVTIFEAAAGGLFIPTEAGVRPGNFITLPNQAVDSKGNISVPYAGTLRAQGRTQVEVQESIVAALRDRAIEPQAVVTLVDQRTSLVSVLGDVNASGRLPLNHAGERILDVVARAGGPRSQGYDEWIMLERNGRRAIAPFAALVYEPVNNIYVHPNDTIYLYREPQTFLAFGAFGGGAVLSNSPQGSFNFDAWRLSLAEAIGKAGGLSNNLADPASLFLYRGETREVAEKLGIDVSPFSGPIIPVIYNVNLRDPAGYFLATTFEIRNKDVLYMSNALSVETSKFMEHLRLITATVNDPIVAALNVYALKAAAAGTPPLAVISN
jgi:polysaccharide export outer membrane protein